MVNPPVIKAAPVRCIVRLEGVGVHHIVRLDLFLDDRQKCLDFGVGDDHVDLCPVSKSQTRLFCQRHLCPFCLCTPIQMAHFYLSLSESSQHGTLNAKFMKPLEEHSNGVPALESILNFLTSKPPNRKGLTASFS